MQQILDALQSPIRREILALIWDEDRPAGEIAAAFEVTAPTISQHLAVLYKAGLVTRVSTGTYRRYRARRDVLQGLHTALFGDSAKWMPADDLPERALAVAHTGQVVVAMVDVDTDPDTTFRAFTDPVLYSRWLGVPVTIDDGRFACTMEFGTRVRGTYEVVHAPSLLAMRWDFEDDNVPVPGGETTCYLRVRATDTGSRIEVQQLVDTAAQAEFMEVAWTMVLGRCKANIATAVDPDAPARARAPRPKRRSKR